MRSFRPCKVEPWAIDRVTGEIRRVVIHREYLNARQERFVLEYLKDGNGTQAAIRAGYAISSAAVHAHRLLKHEIVLEKIRDNEKHVQQSHEALVDKTLREFASIAFCDPGPLFDRKWNLLPPGKIPMAARRALDCVNIRESGKGSRRVRVVQIKMADKNVALTALAHCLGLYPKPPRAGR